MELSHFFFYNKIDNLLKALENVNSDKIHIRFDLIGVSVKDIQKIYFCDNYEKIGVYIHNRLPNIQAKEIIKKADFGVLFR